MSVPGFNHSQNNKLQKIENDLAEIKKEGGPDAKQRVQDDLDALQKFMKELPEGVPDEVKSNLNNVFGTLSQALQGDPDDLLNKVSDADTELKQTLGTEEE